MRWSRIQARWRPALVAACLFALCLAVSPVAVAEDDEPNAFQEYLSERVNNLKVGINGILTFPADPVAMAIDGPDILDGWWTPAAHVFGFFGGLLQGGYRVMMGGLDVAFFPIPKMPILGPVPRYKILPLEHDGE